MMLKMHRVEKDDALWMSMGNEENNESAKTEIDWDAYTVEHIIDN